MSVFLFKNMAKNWDHSPMVGWLPTVPGALSSITSTRETKQMMWDAMKVVLKGSFIAALKQSEWCQINNNVPWSLVKMWASQTQSRWVERSRAGQDLMEWKQRTI